jgi:hypothetical protein
VSTLGINANILTKSVANSMYEAILLSLLPFSRTVEPFLENKAFETNFYAPLQLTLKILVGEASSPLPPHYSFFA